MGCLCSTMETNVFRSLSYLNDDASFAKTSCNDGVLAAVARQNQRDQSESQ